MNVSASGERERVLAQMPASEIDKPGNNKQVKGGARAATHVWSRSDSSCFPCACSSAARLWSPAATRGCSKPKHACRCASKAASNIT